MPYLHIAVPPEVIDIPPGSRSTVTISYDTYEVTFSSPIFGNIQSIDVARSTTSNIIGQLRAYQEDADYRLDELQFVCHSVNWANVLEYLALIIAASGNDVTLTDWENRVWTGILLLPDDLTETARTASCTDSNTGEKFQVPVHFIGSVGV